MRLHRRHQYLKNKKKNKRKNRKKNKRKNRKKNKIPKYRRRKDQILKIKLRLKM